MFNIRKIISIAVLFCTGILVASAGLYAINYKYSHNTQANKYFKTAMLYNNTQRYSQATLYFEKAIAEDPNFAAAFFEAAFALQNAGDNKRAISYYEKGFTLDPDFLPGYSQIALLYIEKGEVLKSYKWLKKGEKLYPEDQFLNKMIASVESRYKEGLLLALEAEKNGQNAVVGQIGKGVFIGPSLYKEGEIPIIPAEQKLFDQYLSKVKKLQKSRIEEKAAADEMLQWYTVVFKEYNISTKNFNYMLRKMTHREVPPKSYIPPYLNVKD